MGRTYLTNDSGPIDFTSEIKTIPQYFIQNEMVVETKKVIVHTFQMGDVDDPDLYAAEPLYKWQQTDAGQWVMENSLDTPEWHRMPDLTYWGHKYVITAVLDTKRLTEYYLRFGKTAP
jgi:hypothetical protein